MRTDIPLCRKRVRTQIQLSEIIHIFQPLADGDPQLVHIEFELRGTSSCQANYFRKFQTAQPFSYSRQKGLNHNGFVKISGSRMGPEPFISNQIP